MARHLEGLIGLLWFSCLFVGGDVGFGGLKTVVLSSLGCEDSKILGFGHEVQEEGLGFMV